MDEIVTEGGNRNRLRTGYTTGSCAAAAAGAAARMLLTGEEVSQVRLRTPKGTELFLEIGEISMERGQDGSLQAVSCAVRKDSGDDPDVTNGALIFSRVERAKEPGIAIDGGEGVGRVTRPGLDQPVGNAAINSVPRRMIRDAVREAASLSVGQGAALRETASLSAGQGAALRETASLSVGQGRPLRKIASLSGEHVSPVPALPGFKVTVFVPGGRELARKTFNPRLGIEGGISILGTSGIVEPMSEKALLDTIRAEISVRKSEGFAVLPAVPGNYGQSFFLEKYGLSLDTAVISSNFIYDTVRMAAEAGFSKLLFVGHIGKLVKVAGGIRNTHSKYGDHRMEILAEIAESLAGASDCRSAVKEPLRTASPDFPPLAGASDRGSEGLHAALMECVSTDGAIRILRERGLADEVMEEMTRRIRAVMQGWAGGGTQVEVIVFSNAYGELGRTPGALRFIEEIGTAHKVPNTRSL